MSYSARCHKEDNKIRKECGWGQAAWVGVNFVEPKTDLEKKALDIIKERYRRSGNGGAYMVHVYDIVDLLVDVLEEYGKEVKLKDNLSPAMLRILRDIDNSSDGYVETLAYNLRTVKALLSRGMVTIRVCRKRGSRGNGPVMRRRKGNECQNEWLAR